MSLLQLQHRHRELAQHYHLLSTQLEQSSNYLSKLDSTSPTLLHSVISHCRLSSPFSMAPHFYDPNVPESLWPYRLFHPTPELQLFRSVLFHVPQEVSTFIDNELGKQK
ncbi:hypothetical protein P9112_002728 [Eukaryota sp. TZLM1-RC]